MPTTAREFLADAGPIARLLGPSYEARAQQLDMAAAVEHAMATRERLLVEAGTGVGKSFAYLVPAILRAVTRNERTVVATATISLQEQLITKDIPLLLSALAPLLGTPPREGAAAPPAPTASPATPPPASAPSSPPSPASDLVAQFPLRPVLAKGRGNYLSLRRLQLASQRQDSLLHDDAARRSLHVIEDWAYTTRDGTLSTLPALERADVWDHARSDSDNCMGRKCPNYKNCFYQVARRELEQANLIICNHALFFSDLALRVRGASTSAATSAGSAILPMYDHVIFDEAHNLEDAACDHFGLSLAQPRVSRLLRTLFNPKRRKGYLLDNGLMLDDSESIERAMTLVLQAETASNTFFDELHEVSRRAEASGNRLRRPGMIDNPLTPVMRELSLRLLKIKASIESEADRFELTAFARRAADIADSAEAMVEQIMPNYAYWIDVDRERSTFATDDAAPTRFGPRVSIACGPVTPGELLKRYLWDAHEHERAAGSPVPPPDAGDDFEAALADPPPEYGEPSPFNDHDAEAPAAAAESPARPAPRPKTFVLTSATLATRTIRPGEHAERAETAFAHVMSNLGISAARTLQLGSPFDYARQAKVIVDLSVPDPRADAQRSRPASAGAPSGFAPAQRPSDAAYIRALAARVVHHVRSTRGGAFVLFTSFNTLNACADACRPALERLDLPVLAQGRDGSRPAILQKFIESGSAVLFGAASFWQGVDVRGENLRNVIITRLPFEPPDRPLTQARTERIEQTGANPFMTDALPRAVIRFKQGFGRLIRSATDAGQVVILDPRVRTARYGRLFLDALPPGVPIHEVRDEDIGDEVFRDEWAS